MLFKALAANHANPSQCITTKKLIFLWLHSVEVVEKCRKISKGMVGILCGLGGLFAC